ncbi:methyltransferase domain-containing protein [Domibacillus epiphyticus]|uniref:Methyltransferase type 11 domain-containing protein n=1 Tax=Domibacillus epiphyticus TaxID=1714355 RepID=A0A1V2A4G1_9BACI|nr:methyltransferase domain-containing protein [Domibacillus epiphyticus]OMP65827.1 hypothetical protein BTO28_15530 [Domibacillus epiphyticus]
MDKLVLLKKIKEIYEENENIIAYLKTFNNEDKNSLEDILISYDFQAGSYIKGYENNPSVKNAYCDYLSQIINNIGEYDSILEAGVGEATTLGVTLSKLEKKPNNSYGFDISWSRIKYAEKFIKNKNLNNVHLFTGDLFNTPLKDNSIDIVYTSHSIEPNGGREEEALKELYRITNKYLILLEPSFELADETARTRMKEHGYVTNLYETANNMGYKILEHRLFEVSSNPLNPTGLLIIEKEAGETVANPMCCPVTKTDIILKNNAYYSQDSLLAYPIINNIPCLLPQNAIIATKFLD